MKGPAAVARRALLIHFYMPPAADVGAQITAKFAKYLPEYGWEPHVLAGDARYYANLDVSTVRDLARVCHVLRTRKIPHIQDLYRALRRPSYRMDGGSAGMAATGSCAVSRRSTLWRTVSSLLTVPDDMTGWIPPAVAAGLRMIRRHRVERLFSSGPPWTNHLVAWSLKRLTGLPWAACFEDPWALGRPALDADDVTPASMACNRWLERRIVAAADAVIFLNDFHRRIMIDHLPGIDAGKFIIIPNGYDPDDFAEAATRPAAPCADRFVIVHPGSLYGKRTPRQVFMAVRRLLDRGVVATGDLEMRFLGHCEAAEGRSVATMAGEHGLAELVRVLPRVSRAEAIVEMLRAHLLLLLAHDWVVQVPAKTYQYFRAGRPILALAPEGATADVVRACGAGTVVDPYDVDGIAGALAAQLARLRAGHAPRGASPEFAAQFDRRRLTGALCGVLSALAEPRGSASHRVELPRTSASRAECSRS